MHTARRATSVYEQAYANELQNECKEIESKLVLDIAELTEKCRSLKSHTHLCAHVYTHVFAVFICSHICLHTCLYAGVHVHVYLHVHTHIHARFYARCLRYKDA